MGLTTIQTWCKTPSKKELGGKLGSLSVKHNARKTYDRQKWVDFVRGWYQDFHSSRVLTVFETCLCGHFKASQKEATRMIRECTELGYIQIQKDGMFKILV